jgi:hypothetical protein
MGKKFNKPENKTPCLFMNLKNVKEKNNSPFKGSSTVSTGEMQNLKQRKIHGLSQGLMRWKVRRQKSYL